MKAAILPLGHPNRRGWPLEALHAYVVHSTANLNPGTGDEWHGGYFGRSWLPGTPEHPEPFEKNGRDTFRRGCTHLAFDQDSETQYIPFEEYVPGAGDRPRPRSLDPQGQTKFAMYAFENRQNWRAIQFEICEGGGWSTDAEGRAASWVIQDMLCRGLRVDLEASLHPSEALRPPAPGRVYLVRHHDLTGKDCPAYFVRNQDKWADFVHYIASAVNGGQP